MKNIDELSTEELHERILVATTELIEREVAKKYEGDMDAIARATASVDEPAESPQIKTVKRIANIGERILIVDALSITGKYKNGFIGTVNEVQRKNPKGVFVDEWDTFVYTREYEVIIEEPVPIKSPNQQRYETIQRAREFVESKYFCGNFTDEKVINGYHGHNTVEFIVNREKNTVVAILRLAYGWTGKVQAKGIAKCMPGDVFNEWIGKAIALCKALKIDIPQEFIDAVQPDEVVVGMLVEPKDDTRYDGDSYEVNKIANGRAYDLPGAGWVPKGELIIIDDTSAIYGTD